jgi:hypothetical protein
MLWVLPVSFAKRDYNQGIAINWAIHEGSMKQDLRNNKDFWAGLMFMLTGIFAIITARHYRLGSALNMGPGYFPIVLSGIMIIFGVIIMLKGLSQSEKISGNWSVRALILIPFSVVLFGILIDKAGFIPALIALIFISAAAGRDFKVKEVLLLTVILVFISLGVFIWGLGLPYLLFINFW